MALEVTSLPDTIPSRLPDWRQRLQSYVVSSMRNRFRPGEHDCALFAAGAVGAMTGVDPAASWRGAYRTLADGEVMLKGLGYADHTEAVAAILEEIAPAFARVGDLASVPADDGFAALGVVQGAGVYVLRPSGMAVVDRMTIERAFRV